jgi:hypothetical protein
VIDGKVTITCRVAARSVRLSTGTHRGVLHRTHRATIFFFLASFSTIILITPLVMVRLVRAEVLGSSWTVTRASVRDPHTGVFPNPLINISNISSAVALNGTISRILNNTGCGAIYNIEGSRLSDSVAAAVTTSE